MTPDELLAVDDSIIDADTEDAGKGDDGPEEKAVPVETPGPRRRHQPPWPLCSQEEFLEKVDALKDSPTNAAGNTRNTSAPCSAMA